ncbi:hypothetical protein Ciccas_006204 [Cichlidogyrus casuarinus]|uniref:Uncharacterized protein n=1 Tax=Cichlidogyrus casuarinus TaxID=1844966 RepID=A0ABD2Q7E7_9PLAT
MLTANILQLYLEDYEGTHLTPKASVYARLVPRIAVRETTQQQDGSSLNGFIYEPKEPLIEQSKSFQHVQSKISHSNDFGTAGSQTGSKDKEIIRPAAIEISVYILLGFAALVALIFAVNCGAILTRYKLYKFSRIPGNSSPEKKIESGSDVPVIVNCQTDSPILSTPVLQAPISDISPRLERQALYQALPAAIVDPASCLECQHLTSLVQPEPVWDDTTNSLSNQAQDHLQRSLIKHAYYTQSLRVRKRQINPNFVEEEDHKSPYATVTRRDHFADVHHHCEGRMNPLDCLAPPHRTVADKATSPIDGAEFQVINHARRSASQGGYASTGLRRRHTAGMFHDYDYQNRDSWDALHTPRPAFPRVFDSPLLETV